jgi:septal ring factor EnvC (AmiA/AmiB activator)
LGNNPPLKRARPDIRLRSLWAAGIAGIALAVVAAPGPTAQAQAPKTADEAKEQLEKQRKALKSVEKRTKTLEGDVEELAAERKRLNAKLVDTADLIKKSEGELTATEARLGELEAQEKILRGSLNQRHGQIAKLLAALQRMGRNPPPVLITQREDALKMVRSAMLLAAAFPELGDQARALAMRLKELVRVMTEIRTQGEHLRTEMTRLKDARTRLSGLMEEKRVSLEQRQSELASMRQAAKEIAASETDLNKLIARLDKAVNENTALGDYEKETSKEAAKSSITNKQGSGEEKVAALPIPPKAPGVVELPPGSTLGSPGRIKPEIPFSKAQGRLPLPAQGRRVLAFSEKTQYGGQSKGIVLETRQGAQVTSPCDGWIVYAGEFRSYGQLLIINAGGGYHVLLAGLSQIDVQPGQFVLAAEPVGTMSGWLQQVQPAAAGGAPVLYVEFRKDGKPIDPDPWWVKGHQKVQG